MQCVFGNIFLYERNEYTMKKYMKILTIMCGCSKNKPEEATPLTIYEQLKITDKSLSEADTGVIQEGITNWVKSF